MRIRSIAFALLLVTVGCRWGSTDLQRLVEDPFRYQARSITVRGVVSWSGFLPAVGSHAFELDDGTARLLVLSNRPAPIPGKKIKVAGTFEASFDLGDRWAPVLLDEDSGPRKNGGSSDVR